MSRSSCRKVVRSTNVQGASLLPQHCALKMEKIVQKLHSIAIEKKIKIMLILAFEENSATSHNELNCTKKSILQENALFASNGKINVFLNFL